MICMHFLVKTDLEIWFHGHPLVTWNCSVDGVLLPALALQSSSVLGYFQHLRLILNLNDNHLKLFSSCIMKVVNYRIIIE